MSKFCAIKMLLLVVAVAVLSLAVVSGAGAFELFSATGFGVNVQRYSEAGVAVPGSFVSGASFQVTTGIAFGGHGDLLVTDYLGNKIVRFNADTGAYISTLAIGDGLMAAFGIAVDPANGDIYVAHRSNPTLYPTIIPDAGLITKIAWNGTGYSAPVDIYAFQEGGSGPDLVSSNFLVPAGIAFGPDGNLYVAGKDGEIPADGHIPAIYVFKPTGEFVTKRRVMTPEYVATHNDALIRGLAIHDGYVYVCTFFGGSVLRLPLAQFATAPVEDFLKYPTVGYTDPPPTTFDAQFGPDGKLYVVDWQYRKIICHNGTTGMWEGDFCAVDAPNGGQPCGITFKGTYTPPTPPVTTIDAAKKALIGADVVLTDAIVTEQIFSGTPGSYSPVAFGVEDVNRNNGIRVVSNAAVTPGSRVTITGKTLELNGEIIIDTADAPLTGVVPGTPLGALFMTNKSAGGATYGAQQAVVDDASVTPAKMATGTNNVGILAKISGKVTAVSATGDALTGYFYVDDGSGLKDGTGNIGIKCMPSPAADAPSMVPALNSYVAVTGLVGVQKPSGVNIRCLWTDSFITVAAAP